MLLSIVNDYEKITGKNSIMSACNLSYRLKRSGPKITKKNIQDIPKTENTSISFFKYDFMIPQNDTWPSLW